MKKLTKKQKFILASCIVFALIAVLIYVIVTVETSGVPFNFMF